MGDAVIGLAVGGGLLLFGVLTFAIAVFDARLRRRGPDLSQRIADRMDEDTQDLTLPACRLCQLSERAVFIGFEAAAKQMPELDRLDKRVAGLYLIPEEN